MKKQLAVVLAILTLFVSAGCSPADTQDANKAQTTQEQQVDKGKAEKPRSAKSPASAIRPRIGKPNSAIPTRKAIR